MSKVTKRPAPTSLSSAHDMAAAKRSLRRTASAASASSSRSSLAAASPPSSPRSASSDGRPSAVPATPIAFPAASLPTTPSNVSKFDESFFIDCNDPEWWLHPIRLPDTFPRDDWTSVTWSADLFGKYCSGGTFQWASKFASDAVADALEGRLPWEEVGDHGIYLAIVDLMLQCRDYLRIERNAELMRTLDYSRSFITHQVWLERCTVHAHRIFDLVISKVPSVIGARLDRAEALRLCLAAVVRDFSSQDAFTSPDVCAPEYLVPITYLQQYHTTPEQLDKYGVFFIQGSVSLDADDATLVRAAAEWDEQHGPAVYTPRPLLARPPANPPPAPKGPVPGVGDVFYKRVVRHGDCLAFE